jgi:hypothetical protein
MPFSTWDQDTMNIAVMRLMFRLALSGPKRMDFINGGFIMSHGSGSSAPTNLEKEVYEECAQWRAPLQSRQGLFGELL